MVSLAVDDRKLRQIVAYFRADLTDRRVTESMIDELVENDLFTQNLAPEQKRKVARLLKSQIIITQDAGAIITEATEPWLTDAKSDIDWFYWDRLKSMLLDGSPLSPNVISILDKTTDDILDCCGNPRIATPWSSRGMVIGHVQSGKTTNYSALITKAADAGYKVIILLAGITNSLRSQTQQRIDEYFIGRKSVFNASALEPLPLRQYGGGRLREPDYGTSRDSDFKRDNVAASASLRTLKEPKIFVLKKNKSVLENLNTWIRDQAHDGKIDEPILLIDDEADNASINTQKDPKRTTAINGLIRDTLSHFNRSSFVGYTATPFANIFIDPESMEEMENEDLFPRNFIKALDPPTNYCGAHKYFTENGELSVRSVVSVDDYQDILPLKHKKELEVTVLPESLYHAIRVFVLARTIRLMRGDGNKHATMMINVSRFNDVQTRLNGAVYTYLDKLKNAAKVSARSRSPMSDPDLSDLAESFCREYADVTVDDENVTFEDVLLNLNDAISTVFVSTVNMRAKSSSLNYDANKKSGLHLITIGGLALSRGLTLEGLVTTYLLRNVGSSDTLMQMARWFGYRPDYEDLCRIYLPKSAIEHYREVHKSIEELREEINLMEDAEARPIDFGLKVRQSPTGIRITAANKMRSAKELKLAAGYAGRFIQVHEVLDDANVDAKNRTAFQKFFKILGRPHIEDKHQPWWHGVSVRDVLELMKELEFPDKIQSLAKLNNRRSLLSDYITDRQETELSDWDVVVAARGRAGTNVDPVLDLVEGETLLNPVIRDSAERDPDRHTYKFSGSKQAIGDADTPMLGLTLEEQEQAKRLPKNGLMNRYSAVRKKPLLIVFPVAVKSGEAKHLGKYTLSLAISLPKTELQIREHTYQITKVLQEQMRREYEESVDEDQDELG